MELHSEKTLSFARNALKSHVATMAADHGIKESTARANISKSIGVDPSSIRQFVNGEIVKPALKTMQKYVTWLANNPESQDFDERDAERGNRMPTKEELRQKITRLRDDLDHAQSYMQELREKRDELLDRHQAAHPENSYWMENSEALIEISTGCMYEADNVRKRVCTIPIPILQGNWRWDQEEETREENNARREKALSESFGKVYQFARSITELYSNLGGWPDDEVIVDVRFQNIEGM